MFRFLIQPEHDTIEKEEQVTKFASFFLEITINGVPIRLPEGISVTSDDFELSTNSYARVNPHGVEISHFGITSAKSEYQSKTLMHYKEQLPKAIVKLADQLAPNYPAGTINLDTGDELTIGERRTIAYHFNDEVIETVDKVVHLSSCIHFKCYVPRPCEVWGIADGLTVRLDPNRYTGYHKGDFVLAEPGTLVRGVDEMRAEHSDETIRAAFKDLANKLLTLDKTPAEAESWTAETKTELQLVAQ